jgi:FAD/FMN-containing dehydrogenase
VGAAGLEAALVGAVGKANVHRDGALLVSPGSEAEVAAVLRACAACDAGVVARGGGTASDWGAPPGRCDVVLSTLRLDGVVDHAHADMVCVVRAGTRMRDLQLLLAAHGQRLSLDPPRAAASSPRIPRGACATATAPRTTGSSAPASCSATAPWPRAAAAS